MSIRLYEIAEQYKALESLEASEDLPAEVIRDTLEALEGDLQEKGKQVAYFFRNLDASAQAIEEAASKMMARAKLLRARSESLRAYLQANMTACGITKIECPYFTLSLKQNPPAVIVESPEQVPDEYWVQPEAPPAPERRIDKVAVAKAIKAGVDVPGCRSERGERLEVK